MDGGALGDLLAPVNAALNLTSALALVTGYRAIRRRHVRQHRKAMLTAAAASGLFLVSYLTRYALTGTHRLAAEGLLRTLYLLILFSHMVLAALAGPLVIRLLYLALRHRFHQHARLARWVFPVWLYVSLTGLVVYALLYHVVGYESNG